VMEENRDSGRILGAEVENLTRDEKLALGITYGVRLSSIGKGVFKDRGVPEGFVITHIDKAKVYTAQEVRKILAEKKGAILLEGIGPDGEKDAFAITVK